MADGLDSRNGVAVHGVEAFVEEEIVHDMPLREERIDGDVFDHGGKGFVEPKIVPPLHGDKIAEPLMGELVGNDDGDAFARFDAGFVVDEEQALAIGYEPPIFHGTGLEVGKGNLVKFGKRVGGLEFIGEEIESVGGDLVGEIKLAERLVERGIGGNLYAVFAFGFDFVKFADYEGEEVGGHFGGLVEDGLGGVL